MIISDEKPIFIVGGGRSGTTLARYILNSHPNIYIAEEISYHGWMARFHGSFRSKLKKYFHTFSYLWFRQNPENVLKKLPHDLTKKHFSLVYKEILKTKAQTYQRGRFGEKNPLLLMALKDIFRDFPNAKIINIVRDPRAIVFSHTTMPFGSSSLLFSAFAQKYNFDTLKKYEGKILDIKLEDLIAEPRQTIGTMLDFIEEPWSDRVLDHAKYTLHDDGIPFPWLNEASKERKQKSLKWTDGLSPAWIRMTEWLNREQMQKFNYAPHPLTGKVSLFDCIRAIVADIPQQIYSMYRTTRMFWLTELIAPDKTWEIQEIVHSINPKAFEYHPGWAKKLPELEPRDIYRELAQ